MLDDVQEALRWENIKKSHLAYLRAYGWYFALSLVAALIAPDDILASFPFLADYFVDPVSSSVSFLVPIQRWAELSKFPEVTRLTLALLCVTYPIVTLHYFFLYQAPKQLKSRGAVLFSLCLVVPIAFLIPWFLIFNYTDHSYRGSGAFVLRQMGAFAMTSRLGLGLVAPLLLSVSSNILVMIPGILFQKKRTE
ncbi:MAG: hypothetical protein LBL72_07695 [Candidatus Accumulibacter sp.]|jgi:hypothetical protein|nr:hypothetical protein [Accumulibacter sp.]